MAGSKLKIGKRVKYFNYHKKDASSSKEKVIAVNQNKVDNENCMKLIKEGKGRNKAEKTYNVYMITSRKE